MARFLSRRLGLAALSLLIALAALFSCSSARLFVANLPSRWLEGRLARDIVFDPATGLTLDVYRPAETDGAEPVVVFFHGGGWQSGDKNDYAFIGEALSDRGYVVAIPDYRKYPEVRFPAFVEDGAAAVAWVARSITTHGGDPEMLFLAGHSAGAHTATLLASDGRYLAEAGLSPSRIRGVAGLAGPYHFTPTAPEYVAIFGPPERFPRMQVSRFVETGAPPMLLMYGLADETVGPQNLARMTAALRTARVCHEVIRYPEVDHIDIISAFTWVYRDDQPMLDDMLGFFEQIRRDGCRG